MLITHYITWLPKKNLKKVKIIKKKRRTVRNRKLVISTACLHFLVKCTYKHKIMLDVDAYNFFRVNCVVQLLDACAQKYYNYIALFFLFRWIFEWGTVEWFGCSLSWLLLVILRLENWIRTATSSLRWSSKILSGIC